MALALQQNGLPNPSSPSCGAGKGRMCAWGRCRGKDKALVPGAEAPQFYHKHFKDLSSAANCCKGRGKMFTEALQNKFSSLGFLPRVSEKSD